MSTTATTEKHLRSRSWLAWQILGQSEEEGKRSDGFSEAVSGWLLSHTAHRFRPLRGLSTDKVLKELDELGDSLTHVVESYSEDCHPLEAEDGTDGPLAAAGTDSTALSAEECTFVWSHLARRIALIFAQEMIDVLINLANDCEPLIEYWSATGSRTEESAWRVAKRLFDERRANATERQRLLREAEARRLGNESRAAALWSKVRSLPSHVSMLLFWRKPVDVLDPANDPFIHATLRKGVDCGNRRQQVLADARSLSEEKTVRQLKDALLTRCGYLQRQLWRLKSASKTSANGGGVNGGRRHSLDDDQSADGMEERKCDVDLSDAHSMGASLLQLGSDDCVDVFEFVDECRLFFEHVLGPDLGSDVGGHRVDDGGSVGQMRSGSDSDSLIAPASHRSLKGLLTYGQFHDYEAGGGVRLLRRSVKPLSCVSALIELMTGCMRPFVKNVKRQLAVCAVPSHWRRNWKKYILVVSSASVCLLALHSLELSPLQTSQQLASDYWASVGTFLNDHLYLPLNDMYTEVFAHKALRGPKNDTALWHEEKAHLEQMVEHFVGDGRMKPKRGSSLEICSEEQQFSRMEHVMELYKDEMHTPLKSALFGSIVENVLIQVQKMKVEMAALVVDVDRVLDASRFNVNVMATLPAIGVLYLGLSGLGTVVSLPFAKLSMRRSKKESEQLRRSLRRLHSMSLFQGDALGEGSITLSANERNLQCGHMIQAVSQLAVTEARGKGKNAEERAWLLFDLEALLANEWVASQRLQLIQRMERYYV